MSYEGYLAGEPVVVTAALTGGVHGKEANPNIPETPEEIGRAAAAVEEAGAAVVHLHARRPNGERDFSTGRFQAIDDAVRRYTDDVIVQHSTGGTGAPDELRHQLPFAALGILLGGNVRVGLEDNVYYRASELAESNAQLVERVVELAELLGREVATPAQARAQFGLERA